MDLRTALESIKHVSDTTYSRIADIAEVRTVKKGERVIRQGRKDYIFLFFKEGIFRLWFAANGKERIIGFGTPGDPFISISTYRKYIQKKSGRQYTHSRP